MHGIEWVYTSVRDDQNKSQNNAYMSVRNGQTLAIASQHFNVEAARRLPRASVRLLVPDQVVDPRRLPSVPAARNSCHLTGAPEICSQCHYA